MPQQKITLENFFKELEKLFEKTGFKPSEKWQQFRSKSKKENIETLDSKDSLSQANQATQIAIQESHTVLDNLKKKEKISSEVTKAALHVEEAAQKLVNDKEIKLLKGIREKLRQLWQRFKTWRELREEKRASLFSEYNNFKDRKHDDPFGINKQFQDDFESIKMKDKIKGRVKEKLNALRPKKKFKPGSDFGTDL